MKTILSVLGFSLLILTSCNNTKTVEKDFIQDNIDNAAAQNTIQTDIIEKSGRVLNPRTIDKDGNIVYIPIDDWCSGFYPGSIWLTYELTGDKKWLPLAVKYTEALDSVKHLKWHHDVGFMIGCSYLNGYRLAIQRCDCGNCQIIVYSFSSECRSYSVVGCRQRMAEYTRLEMSGYH